ncbi:MAG: DinB family protein [Acidimicrobiales bacterium]
MALPPDTKDWTWVLERPCPECGFDPANYPADLFAETLRDLANAWSLVLTRDDVSVRAREDRWSDLEYGCHVRDVSRVMDERLAAMLAHDDPVFANWDQDETALRDHYAEQPPALVRRELLVAFGQFAQRVESVTPDAWSRPGTRSNGSRFTVESLIRYGLHDVIHHLWDVSAGNF